LAASNSRLYRGATCFSSRTTPSRSSPPCTGSHAGSDE
jgi:hypothetical protein